MLFYISNAYIFVLAKTEAVRKELEDNECTPTSLFGPISAIGLS